MTRPASQSGDDIADGLYEVHAQGLPVFGGDICVLKRVAPQAVVESDIWPAKNLRQLVVCRRDGLGLGQVHVVRSDGSGWPRIGGWLRMRRRPRLGGNIELFLEVEPAREGVAVEAIEELLGVDVELHHRLSVPRHEEVDGS